MWVGARFAACYSDAQFTSTARQVEGEVNI